MEKIYIVIGTDTAWDVDSGWSPLMAFRKKQAAERFVKEWENKKPATDFESFAAYIMEVEIQE